MLKTEKKNLEDKDGKYLVVVNYGFDHDFARRHNQDVHFTFGYTMYHGRMMADRNIISFGRVGTEIIEHFPHLAPLVKWHLCTAHFDGTKIVCEPMHYIANAIYWYEHVMNCSQWPREKWEPDPLEAFKDTVVWAAFDGDALPNVVVFHRHKEKAHLIEDEKDTKALERGQKYHREDDKLAARLAVKEHITNWCLQRQEKLTEAFKKDMNNFDIQLKAQ